MINTTGTIDTTSSINDLNKITNLQSDANDIDSNNPKFNNTNRIDNNDYNFSAADLTSNVIMGGTSSQPNRIGVETFHTSFIGDGIQTVFDNNIGFISPLLLDSDVIAVIEYENGKRVPQDGAKKTVTGDGTGTDGKENATWNVPYKLDKV